MIRKIAEVSECAASWSGNFVFAMGCILMVFIAGMVATTFCPWLYQYQSLDLIMAYGASVTAIGMTVSVVLMFAFLVVNDWASERY